MKLKIYLDYIDQQRQGFMHWFVLMFPQRGLL